MLSKLRTKAQPDPRYGNPFGLKLDMGQFISFCVRHAAEIEEFPKAKKLGWPTKLDDRELTARVRNLKPKLQELLDDPSLGVFFEALRRRARDLGSNAITGIGGHWATFKDASTGYYGEQGSAIITQVIFDLFPALTSINTAPLSNIDYYFRVLVPEAALFLVQEDLTQRLECYVTREQALVVLRASTAYGLTAFPITDGLGKEREE
ncbi:hypothetical protein M408DRAFT_30960 [Serendipita vermifera MAFF 305830]|uniref:Restriction of telomere capping protein 4 n=1 Tax=Serendipita vermifera MAFF 305830 TaxID=933852 RepID=A0A0C2VZN4_SERVB|nr:hypothetical protein M408DRAFT_30960 [Serendipita vermifera MAFF 305830]